MLARSFPCPSASLFDISISLEITTCGWFIKLRRATTLSTLVIVRVQVAVVSSLAVP